MKFHKSRFREWFHATRQRDWLRERDIEAISRLSHIALRMRLES